MNLLPTASHASNNGIFVGVEQVLISGGTYTTVVNPRPSSMEPDLKWIDTLRKHTATGAFHNSGERRDAPKCHPRTRIAVIKEIIDWVVDSSRQEQVLWIYGPAGSGKSSIAQTVAEICERKGLLASDYFFSRTAPGRNTDTSLIPTLACQLTVSLPDICSHMAAAINSDSLIFSRSLPTQLDALIVKPFAQLMLSDKNDKERACPNLIIIDGLDECQPPDSQRHILSSLASIFQHSFTPLIFLIASRPEQPIREVFNGDLSVHTRRLVLDDKYHPDKDIETLLNSKFEDIKRNHPLSLHIPADWPSASDIDYLVQMASGQFIYASTVVKFIASPRHRPLERLKIVLGLASPGDNAPFADLDALYKHILLSVDNSTLDSAMTLFAFLFAVAQIDFWYYWNVPDVRLESHFRTLGFVEAFLGHQPGDLLLILEDLHSIVDVPPVKSTGKSTEIRLFHASMSDFLQDKARSGTLFVDMGIYCAKFARLCIRHLTPWFLLNDTNISQTLPTVLFSHFSFLQLFPIASFDKNLLHDLSLFPIASFIKGMFHESYPVFPFVSRLFDWIKPKDPRLYEEYTAQMTDHIKSRLTSANNPHWQDVFTAMALNIEDNNAGCFYRICGTICPADDFAKLQQHFFGGPDHGVQLNIDDYISRLFDILTSPEQTGDVYVNTHRYVDFALKLLDILADSVDGAQFRKTFYKLLFATLIRAPRDPELAESIAGKRHCWDDILFEDKDSKEEFFYQMQAYLKDYNSSMRVPPGEDDQRAAHRRGRNMLLTKLKSIVRR